MLFLSFEEFNNEFGIDNEPICNIRIKDISKDISLTPVEIIMRDEKTETIKENNFNIIVNIHPTDGTRWDLVIRRGGGKVYYFDSFGVETPLLFLEEYVDLGSKERIQEYDESYCGSYFLYMIYLIDRRFTIEGALDILVNQVKCPDGYKKCQCLGCKFKAKVEVNVNDNDNANDSVNGNGNDNANDNGNDNDNVNDKNDDDKYISIFSEQTQSVVYQRTPSVVYQLIPSVARQRDEVLGSPTKQRDKPCSQCGCAGALKASMLGASVNSNENFLINVNGSLQSWITDSNITVGVPFPENLICIIEGPSECGKTLLLKNLFIPGIQFGRFYIIGPTGNQYNDLLYKDIVFINDINELPHPDELPKYIKKLMLFDDVID